MFVLVRLLKGFPKPLFYKISSTEQPKNWVGKIIQVSLKNIKLPALVLNAYENLPEKVNFKIKEIDCIQDFPDDDRYYSFIKKISEFYFLEPLYFYQRIRHFLFEVKSKKIRMQIRKSLSDQRSENKIVLTQEQTQVLKDIRKLCLQVEYNSILLHGVTGSGKTEIYKKLIIDNIKEGKSVIFLIPEVGLSLQFQFLLQRQLPQNIPIFGFHSASSEQEKKDLWKNLLEGKPIVVFGVHLPVLLPFSNLGLIIVDEEHETGFQEKKHPKINSKEIALWRAKDYKIPIILGSATPSLNSLFNVNKNKCSYFQLKERFAGSMPKIDLIFMKEKTEKRRKCFWISQKLEDAIKDRLAKKEQTIIYLNRRGYSFFVQCKQCGFIFQCPNCSVSLTLHSSFNEGSFLRCHYCDFRKPLPENCSECKANKKEFLTKGIGTQQAVELIQELFPQAKIARADLDSTVKKKLWQQTLQDFKKGEIDILVGTQTITKGYHFPKVTLVGILWADLNLHLPFFNSAETTLQKIIQVAGRAGRQSSDSLVVVQAIHDHYIFNFLNERHYLDFCKEEMEFREQTKYPPFGRLIQVEFKGSDTKILEKESAEFTDLLRKINEGLKLDIQILGPSRPVVYKVKRTEVRQVFLKTDSFTKISLLFKNINFENFKSSIYIVPTP